MKDIHAVITERFIDQFRAGTVPWQRPWRGAQNIVSRKAYRGINSLTLGLSNFGSPYWMTFRQALELGGHVRKGERSTPIIYYKFFEKRDGAGQLIMTAKGMPAFRPFIRWSNVFNLDQTEGIQPPVLPVSNEIRPALSRAEALVQTADLCPIRHEGFAAAYSPTEDLIRMPRQSAFRAKEEYFHTLFHEMTHATGHGSRLDRDGITKALRFGSELYSKEELVAELGAAFLSNEAGILDQVVFNNSAAYLQSWITKLEEDHTLLTSAASQAQRSFDWMTGQQFEEQEKFVEDMAISANSQAEASRATSTAYAIEHGRSAVQGKRTCSRHSSSHRR